MVSQGLGYLGINATDPDAWSQFANRVLGLREVDGPRATGGQELDNTRFFKMDRRQWRLAVHQSDQDGYAYAGWEVHDAYKLEAAAERLEKAGVSVERMSPEFARRRGVAQVVRAEDPSGHQIELYYGQIQDTPFVSELCTGGFKTDGVGMGHILLLTNDSRKSVDFYTQLLGFKMTDYQFMGGDKTAWFMHCTTRHHSVAVTDLAGPCGMHHMMLEVNALIDCGLAYDRAQELEYEITTHIGQHTNDHMLSFYVKTPGGFDLEFGWGGREIDQNWVVQEVIGSGDLWGHRGTMMDDISDNRVEHDSKKG